MTSSFKEGPPSPEDAPGKGDVPGQAGAERRSDSRRPVHWRVRLMHDSGSGQVVTHGKAVDASMAGITLLCDLNLVKSTRLVLVIALPVDKHPEALDEIHVSATVVNTIYTQGGFRLGLQFTQFHGRAKVALASRLA